MTSARFITASLRHYRRIHVAVALGVAVATAVLTGALLVGDSVRGSLRDLTLQRLGRIDSALVTGHMFRATLADELAADAGFQQHFAAAEPAILMSGTLQSGSGRGTRRATSISVIGCRTTFWSLGQGGPQKPLAENVIALTEPLARELRVGVGGEVLLRVPIAGAIPADSPLGEKSDTALARRLKVVAVLAPEGLARFGLVPSQHLPRNVFVPLATMQKLLDKPDQANAILAATDRQLPAASELAHRALDGALRPKLVDFGLRIEPISSPTNCLQLSAGQLVLPDEVVRAAERAFRDPPLQPVITYLANTLAVGEGESRRKIPYSTITGVDSTAELGPLVDAAGQPIQLANERPGEPAEIALNRWAADDLQVEIGDLVTVTYYEPESTHGRLREHQPPPVFKLRAIIELETDDGEPTPAADPKLTPELPGVTDQESINDWDLPFELVEKIRPQDEDYWDKYRTTPKAFVSLATAKRLWPSRWGTISVLRIPAASAPGEAAGEAASAAAKMAHRLTTELNAAKLGMAFLPVKQQGLAAASGTTPFDGLFLGFSLFLIAAAVMLVAILFHFGVEQRAAELGTLAAVGVARQQVARLLSREGLVVAATGATVGVVAGVLYAWLMILGLRTWWLAAIATPFMELHVTPRSLVLGWIIGIAVSWLTVRWSIRRLVRAPAARLLAGETGLPNSSRRSSGRSTWAGQIAIVILATVISALMLLARNLHGETQAAVFFGIGAAFLAWLLIVVRYRLVRGFGGSAPGRRFALTTLSTMNLARNPGRSTLTIGLVAAASFLIVAVSAFRLDTGDAGTGGFEFIATSDQPIHYDLNTPEGRLELGFSDAASRRLEGWRVYSLRVSSGEDASCLNLYRPTQPRVLGVPDALVDRGGFSWAATSGQAAENAWALLHTDLGKDAANEPVVPVVIDASTAIYSLHLSGVGSRLTIRDAADRPVTLQVVGLLKNSVLQGNLLVSEADFLRLFPDTGGYRYFLIEQAVGPPSRNGTPTRHLAKPAAGCPVPATLESTLAEVGFDTIDAREQLAAFLAVQNTYLSTFQSLGALGLLLGTIGLAVVQLRSVLERRGELALMRAAGFANSRLVWMVIGENAVLLVGGLIVGCLAAAVALLPQWAPQGAGIPWAALALLLGTIAVVGLTAGWLATRSALQASILPTLRGD